MQFKAYPARTSSFLAGTMQITKLRCSCRSKVLHADQGRGFVRGCQMLVQQDNVLPPESHDSRMETVPSVVQVTWTAISLLSDLSDHVNDVDDAPDVHD